MSAQPIVLLPACHPSASSATLLVGSTLVCAGSLFVLYEARWKVCQMWASFAGQPPPWQIHTIFGVLAGAHVAALAVHIHLHRRCHGGRGFLWMFVILCLSQMAAWAVMLWVLRTPLRLRFQQTGDATGVLTVNDNPP